jgi:hypothetical protein
MLVALHCGVDNADSGKFTTAALLFLSLEILGFTILTPSRLLWPIFPFWKERCEGQGFIRGGSDPEGKVEILKFDVLRREDTSSFSMNF